MAAIFAFHAGETVVHIPAIEIPANDPFRYRRRPNLAVFRRHQRYDIREQAVSRQKGYQYSYFCDLFHAYRGNLNYSMRQEHKAAGNSLNYGTNPMLYL